jgi:hypothetical protein
LRITASAITIAASSPPDRDGVGDQMLPDALVNPLVAATQQGELGLGRQIAGERIVELAARRGKQDDAPALAALPVGRVQRRVDGVDPQHHAGPAAVGRVINLAAAERRRVAVIEEADLRPPLERVAQVPLPEEPLEPLGEEGEDVKFQ